MPKHTYTLILTQYVPRILKIYNRICWRHLCWRLSPCSGSHRQLGPEGLPLLSSRSFTMIVLPRVTMTSITFLGRHVGFPQTMWMWFWLLMWTVNNILVTVVSLCEIGPRCNHDVPQLRVLEGILFWKKAGGKKRHSTCWGRGPSSGLISTGSHR